MKAIALALAVVFFVVAVLYFTGIGLGQHTKHGVLFAVLGALALIWYRFQSAAASSTR